ncbi:MULTISPECIES: aldo/keto reductase [Sorangium]|uniref:Aldo/keto reductase n=1 Tax=Sorangium cellulosum TaxID=56 RepID=A0A4P2R079_SORCE|nr:MULTISPECIES: aldo/keto reductase [Sorangium]AUX36310.1 aldo/keto reductase [Sorangium cellulosum]WCQ95609.1 1-deoxyxylulose-5-phosphate synthase YajO [Sorangium sp. Soce836]
MEYRPLGPTAISVSRLCLGTVNFGLHTSEGDAFPLLDRAIDCGINFVDTAEVYSEGRAESIIGDWLALGQGRRSRIVLATKVFRGADEPRLSARHILEACEQSLRRLRTDRIDLYQVHHVDRACPWEELWQAMDQLVRQGKVLHVGSSNFAAWDIASANNLSRQRQWPGFVSEQSVYNLRRRMIELEVIPCCRALGMALLAYSPLGGGLLGGGLTSPAPGRRADSWVQRIAEQHREQLSAFEGLCQEAGHRTADVALAWVLRNTAVTAAIIGPRTVEQLVQNVGAMDMALSEEVVTRLEQIWPGPGGEAPQAYAW